MQQGGVPVIKQLRLNVVAMVTALVAMAAWQELICGGVQRSRDEGSAGDVHFDA